MNVRECYECMQADYEDVIQRLLNEERVKKYLFKMIDADYMHDLEQALHRNDYEEGFRMSHSLKGICLNLSLTGLFRSSQALCEDLRSGSPVEDPAPLLEAVKRDYQQVKEAVLQLDR